MIVRSTEATIEMRIIARHPTPPPSGRTSTLPNRTTPHYPTAR